MKYKIQSSGTCSASVPDDAADYTESDDVSLDNENYNGMYVCFWSTDQGGNTGKAVSAQISGIDTVGPVVAVSSITGAGTRNVSATDDDSGTTVMKYKIQSGSSCSAAVPGDALSYTEGDNVSLDQESYNGMYVCFWSTDSGNNVGKAVSAQISGVDLTSPVVTVDFVIGAGATLVSAVDDDSAATVMKYKIQAGSACSATVPDDASSYTEGANVSLDNESYSGLYVCFWSEDAGGNVGKGRSDQVLVLESPLSLAGGSFVSVWNTSATSDGSSNSTSISLPLEEGGSYNFVVDWGDGAGGLVTSWDSANASHDYGSGNGGVKTVNITGVIEGFRFNNTGDRKKLVNITNWGFLRLGDNGSYFYGAENLENVSGFVNLTGTTDLSKMFMHAFKFNANISDWNVSEATNMSHMFSGLTGPTTGTPTAFNQDIGGWDTGRVTDMSYMFIYASSFNQNLSGWDTGNVTSMRSTFYRAANFNGDIGGWDTGRVTDMRTMFAYTNFDQDIGGWDTGRVTSMMGHVRLHPFQSGYWRLGHGQCYEHESDVCC